VRGSLACLGGLLVAGGHALPALTGVRPVRLAVSPSLSGVGRSDHVALTFDDGPDARSTPVILAALERQGWRATFFMLGRMVERNRDVAADVAARGHEVALHGYDHVSHLRRSPGQVHDDLRRGCDLVADATGQAPRWFRPPYGLLSAGTCWAAPRLGLRTVLWTAWGRDWRAEATAESVSADVGRGLRPGATVLLHDSDCTSAAGAWRSAESALPRLAELFAAHGLTVGPLGEHQVGRDP
jgi:peptidoglycan/xylan/chitin deacetylase (PgdA/CDA1 family)